MSSESLIQIGEPRTDTSPLDWPSRLERLREGIAKHRVVVVAYSGGVDSSLVLRVAHEVLGADAHGVIGRSDSYASEELRLAIAQAESFGSRIEIVSTGELSDPNFRSNSIQRCYFCKTELYRELAGVAARVGASAIFDGTIADDLGDWRPGRKAAEERGVRSPLAEAGFTKAHVRAAAEHYGLASHDKPASPCLASRIPYGTEITREILLKVERSEQFLHSLGFRIVRVRHHGERAAIEVPLADLPRLTSEPIRARVEAELIRLGYGIVSFDPRGFRSGSLNEGVVPQ
jgi:uncharacterized protein